MPNALDAFRAQREAFEQMNASLKEFCALVAGARSQIDGLSLNAADLKAVLREEQAWLDKAQAVVAEVRRWREQEVRRFWFAVFWRWALACVFALVSAAVAGAGYAWATPPHAQEIERLRSKADLAEMIDRRLRDLTPAQRREFSRLMKLPEDPKR
jgi:hypothetical protein